MTPIKTYLMSFARLLRWELRAYCCVAIGWLKASILRRPPGGLKVELGAGHTARKPGFLQLDVRLDADIPFDLRAGLPFRSGTVTQIYCEHVLEHFEYRHLSNLLAECHRVLEPRGTLSISVPNARLYLEAYHRFDRSVFERLCRYRWPQPYQSPIDLVNYIFYMDGQHRFMFDETNITDLLLHAGFAGASLREFSAELDQESRRYESLYAIATK
jgi:predicted SAM-dependent methyltransferase